MKSPRQKAHEILVKLNIEFETTDCEIRAENIITKALQEAANVEWPTSKEREDWYSIYRSQFKGKDGYSSYNAIEAYEAWLKSRQKNVVE